ncbi:E3 ubiquitin-protein ligase TRIM47-like [Colossoma macropomum]|uniref:E3 ubiquitin-protein ligase TRIM47-like n=1 Tax=Colossoma macropomum TaxID=42526 RepID=UPI001863BAA2|nr:E3 ubiquitin-protein ligase TRIM47-like [Colossoma macropomum]
MASISEGQGQFSCPVCQDLLKDPVTVLCGHSFCTVCIDGCWDREDQRGVYSCPQCRETFTPRPVLHRNKVMAEMLEKLKKTEVRAASPAFTAHKLVKTSTYLQERICSQHGKLTEIYCHTDQSVMCYLCTMDEHKVHDTVSAAAGRTQNRVSSLSVYLLDLRTHPSPLSVSISHLKN